MARIRRIKIDVTDEQNLLTGLITSDEFCRKVLPMLQPEHLHGLGTRHLLDWVREYHATYGKCPNTEIQSIFNLERRNLTDAEGAVIETLLANLSDRFSSNGKHNWSYQADRARDYIRTRNLELLADNVKLLRDRGELDRAEREVRNFTIATATTSQTVYPLTDQELQRRVLDRSEGGLFKLPGAAGEVFGWWQPGWLVAFIGPPKRGKTWQLGDVAMWALSKYGLRVLFVSLEMSEEDMTRRFMEIASSLPEEKGKVVIPAWDCFRNQDGSCTMPERVNHESLPRDSDDLPHYTKGGSYQSCTVCKVDSKLLHNYRVASWFKTTNEKDSFAAKAIQSVEAYAFQHQGGNLALRCFPRFSADVEDILNLLDEEEARGFIPDILIVDYAGILKEEIKGSGSGWEVRDETWKKLGGLAAERKLLLVTGGQGNAKAMSARSMHQDQIAGYTGINAHLDVTISLNQLGDNERAAMVMRMGCLGMRHGRWPTEEVFVLQNLDLGQPLMDSFAASVGHKLISRRS